MLGFVALFLILAVNPFGQAKYHSPTVRPYRIPRYESVERFASRNRLEQYMLALRDAAGYLLYVLEYEKTDEEKSLRVVFTGNREDMGTPMLSRVISENHRLSNNT